MKIFTTALYLLNVNVYGGEVTKLTVRDTIKIISDSSSGKEFKLLLTDGYYVNCIFPNNAETAEIFSVAIVKLSIFNEQNQCEIVKVDQARLAVRLDLVKRAKKKAEIERQEMQTK